ncbi:MAG: RHS repeat-associated core domain-containing protein [Acidobacteriota bacterium]
METDANGRATRYGYDESGRLLKVTEASGAVTEYTYDKAGNKLTQKDAKNHGWSFRYDALNRLIEEKDPLNRISSYVYDDLGNLKSKTDAKNQTLTYTYNIRRLTKITYPDRSSDNFTYDALGRRTGQSNASVNLTYTYDTLNRLASETNPTFNVALRYEYDANGNQTKMTTPNSVITYSYDGKNRLTSITDTGVGSFGLSYDAMDRRTALRYPNGVTTSYDYDNAYRLMAMVTKNSGGTVLDAWSYGYDAVGNRTTKTDAQGRVDHYAYDEVYRLTEAQYGDGGREGFTYDAVGNRVTRTHEAGVITAYSYDDANQMTLAGGVTYSYDANGNVTAKGTAATYTYDFNNRLRTISGSEGSETSTYAPDGTRFAISSSASNRNFSAILYDRQGNPAWERGGLNRLYGPGVDEPLVEWSPGVDRTRFLHHDALGSITAVTDWNGAPMYSRSYRAFGKMTETQDLGNFPNSRLGYTSREISTGSLMQYRSRWYDSGVGRFTSQDSWRGDNLTPPSLHRYVYVHDDPVNFVDATGHAAVRLDPHWDELLAHAVEVIGVLMVLIAAAGIARSPVVSAVAGWLGGYAEQLYVGTIVLSLAMIVGRVMSRYDASRQGREAYWAAIASTIVGGAIVGIGERVHHGFASRLKSLSFADPRVAALYLDTLLHLAQIMIILWIIDDSITDYFWEPT